MERYTQKVMFKSDVYILIQLYGKFSNFLGLQKHCIKNGQIQFMNNYYKAYSLLLYLSLFFGMTISLIVYFFSGFGEVSMTYFETSYLIVTHFMYILTLILIFAVLIINNLSTAPRKNMEMYKMIIKLDEILFFNSKKLQYGFRQNIILFHVLLFIYRSIQFTADCAAWGFNLSLIISLIIVVVIDLETLHFLFETNMIVTRVERLNIRISQIMNQNYDALIKREFLLKIWSTNYENVTCVEYSSKDYLIRLITAYKLLKRAIDRIVSIYGFVVTIHIILFL